MSYAVFISQPSSLGVLTAMVPASTHSPYEAVNSIRQDFETKLALGTTPFADYLISDTMPIHNLSGLQDLTRVTRMRQDIDKGVLIKEKDGLPNTKFILAPNGKLLTFVGNHTLLAYFLAGKKRLLESPYLALTGTKGLAVTPDELAYFFPPEYREEIASDWEKYTVNWQASGANRLEIRRIRTVAELASEFGKREKGTVKE